MLRRVLWTSWVALVTLMTLEFSNVTAFAQDVGAPQQPAPAVDRFAVPAGGVDELMKFMEGLETFRPTSQAEFMEYREKAPAAIEAAARKIQQLEPDQNSVAYKKATSIILLGEARRIADFSAERKREVLDRVKAHLSDKQLGQEDMPLAMNVTRGLEYCGDEMAAEAYEVFGKIFAASTNPQFKAYGEGFLGSARRLNLVGNALELSGTRMDGTKFRIADLAGKVVLVDFWATWCGPCLAEAPNIKEQYEKYHAAGFEVVGVSLDQDRQALEDYLAKNQTAWITLHEKEMGGRHPATAHYGIMSIPTMFLVGRDGKVLSTKARGEELNRLLEEQFGEVQATDGGEG